MPWSVGPECILRAQGFINALYLTNLDNSRSKFSNQSNFVVTGTLHFLTVVAVNRDLSDYFSRFPERKQMGNGYDGVFGFHALQ